MPSAYHTPDHSKAAFARTNVQTISQRANIIAELFPNVRSIAEVCCGDCVQQWMIYNQTFNLDSFVGVDIDPRIVAANQKQGVHCIQGDALDKKIVKVLFSYDVIFFGPPLTLACDSHSFIPFQDVVPAYIEFTNLMFGVHKYKGTIVCIGSKQTSMRDVNWLYYQVKNKHPHIGLRLLHFSYSTTTGSGDVTSPRLKYVELWMSAELGDLWEVRESRPEEPGE